MYYVFMVRNEEAVLDCTLRTFEVRVRRTVVCTVRTVVVVLVCFWVLLSHV
jgi:hypothetical protein